MLMRAKGVKWSSNWANLGRLLRGLPNVLNAWYGKHMLSLIVICRSIELTLTLLAHDFCVGLLPLCLILLFLLDVLFDLISHASDLLFQKH